MLGVQVIHLNNTKGVTIVVLHDMEVRHEHSGPTYVDKHEAGRIYDNRRREGNRIHVKVFRDSEDCTFLLLDSTDVVGTMSLVLNHVFISV